MRSYLVGITMLLTVFGCSGPSPVELSTEFDAALKKLRAVTSSGGNQKEFRSSLEALAEASDVSPRAEKIIDAYKVSLELWALMDNPLGSGAKINDGPLIGGFLVPVKDGALGQYDSAKPDKRAWFESMFRIMSENRDIVTEQGDQWAIGPDAVQQLWAKAAKL